MWFTHKNNIVRGLVGETITYLSWRRDRCLTTFRSLKIDVDRMLIDPLNVQLAWHSKLSLLSVVKRTSHIYNIGKCWTALWVWVLETFTNTHRTIRTFDICMYFLYMYYNREKQTYKNAYPLRKHGSNDLL